MSASNTHYRAPLRRLDQNRPLSASASHSKKAYLQPKPPKDERANILNRTNKLVDRIQRYVKNIDGIVTAKRKLKKSKLVIAADIHNLISVQNEIVLQDPARIVAEWKPAGSLAFLKDGDMNIFNDNLVFSVECYQDLVDLSAKIPKIIGKYSWLEREKSVVVMKRLYFNLEIIEAQLKDVLDHLAEQYAPIAPYNDDIKTINKSIEELRERITKVNAKNGTIEFLDRNALCEDLPVESVPLTPDNRSFVGGMSTGCSSVSTVQGYISGVHVVTVRIDEIGPDGQLFLGVSSDPSLYDPFHGEKQVLGVVTCHPDTTKLDGGLPGQLSITDARPIAAGHQLRLILDCDQSVLTVKLLTNPTWTETVPLPVCNAIRRFYFSSCGASFTLLD